jgi:predicted DNA-binding protein
MKNNNSKDGMKKTTLRLPVKLAKELKIYCAKKEISQTELLTKIIEQHMENIPVADKT